MTYFSDKAIAAAVEAMKPDRIQGFTYGTENVIRDVYRPWDAQVLWRAPVGDNEAFLRQCEIERLRIGLVAAAKVHDEERAGASGDPVGEQRWQRPDGYVQWVKDYRAKTGASLPDAIKAYEATRPASPAPVANPTLSETA